MTTRRAEVAIVGGGIAGLWALRLLKSSGYEAVLLEAGDLGQGQSLASQGMIHGGIKYTLGGGFTRAAEAIADMPARWRACLQGQAEPHLDPSSIVSDRYYLFAAANTLGRLTGFLASKSLRGRVRPLAPADFPPAFQGFNGVVYELDDLVLDVERLLADLAAPVKDAIYRFSVDASNCTATSAGFELNLGGGERLSVDRLVACAGAGNAALAELGLTTATPMQRRPLHQAVVTLPLEAPIYAHCLTGIARAEPRLTLTTHRFQTLPGNRSALYIGGQLATSGVDLSAEALCARARRELADCLPWLDLRDAEVKSYRVDRAEPLQPKGRRPDEAFVEANGNLIVCWPTKLSLTPDLGDRLLALLPPAAAPTARRLQTADPAAELPLARATVGHPDWLPL